MLSVLFIICAVIAFIQLVCDIVRFKFNWFDDDEYQTFNDLPESTKSVALCVTVFLNLVFIAMTSIAACTLGTFATYVAAPLAMLYYIVDIVYNVNRFVKGNNFRILIALGYLGIVIAFIIALCL